MKIQKLTHYVLVACIGFVIPGALAQHTTFYFVRHGETGGTGLLNEKGKAQAKILADTLRDIPFTHVFSPHTTRTLQTVEPIAQRRSLKVVQLPVPGSTVNGTLVTNDSPSKIAAEPLVEALRRVPDGSVVLICGNRENLFAMMHGLGVPLATAERPYSPDQTAIPGLDGSRYPGGAHLWILSLDGPSRRPHLIHLRPTLSVEPIVSGKGPT